MKIKTESEEFQQLSQHEKIKTGINHQIKNSNEITMPYAT
jgi:hypothetical protein